MLASVTSVVSLSSHVLVTSFKMLHSVVPALEYVASYWTSDSSNVDFNTKHLGKGDPLPPFTGKLRIYNMRYCPYAHRTMLALNAKQLDYEVVNVDLMNKPEWMASKGVGKVPTLEIAEDVCIYESLVTVEYLDEVYPQPPLLSKDPVQRAYDKIIVEAFEPVTSLYYQALVKPDAITDDARSAFNKALDFIQDQLSQRGTKFFGGSEPGYVDYMIWPWFERIVQLDGLDGHARIDQQKYKLLSSYITEMFKDPVVSKYLVPEDILKIFIVAYRKKLPIDYDLLLEK